MMRVCRLSDVWHLSVSLPRISGLSREQRGLWKIKMAHRKPTSHLTRTPLSRSKGQRSTSAAYFGGLSHSLFHLTEQLRRVYQFLNSSTKDTGNSCPVVFQETIVWYLSNALLASKKAPHILCNTIQIKQSKHGITAWLQLLLFKVKF